VSPPVPRRHTQAKVAVLGAAGGIGQPLSLLLKGNPLIGELSLYDVANTAGVACDISHISTAARVRAYTGPAQLHDALTGCQLVVIPAGEGMGRGGGLPRAAQLLRAATLSLAHARRQRVSLRRRRHAAPTQRRCRRAAQAGHDA
jgi:malate dehydrogenase